MNAAHHITPLTLTTSAHRYEHVAIFGATGGIGRQLVDQALASGRRVTALVRRPDALEPRPGLDLVVGDVTDPQAVRAALGEADAAIVALGAPAMSKSRVRSEGTATIAAAMAELGLTRMMCVSVYGAAETRRHLPFFLRFVIFPTYLRRPVADHERQEALLAETDLDYTCVRPPNLTDGPVTGAYAHGFSGPTSDVEMYVSRADVAHFILEELEAGDYNRQAVAIANP